jgi:hypothetical protein
MTHVRIKSVYVENGLEKEDSLVFDTIIQEDGFIKPMEFFGYAIEDKTKYPIIIKKNNDTGVIEWGPADEDTDSSINIYNKVIKVGEYFTRTDKNGNHTNNYTYKILRILNLDEVN